MRELQAKEMDLKNASIVEFNLRQEIEQMGTQRLDLEEQLQDFQSNICQMQIQLSRETWSATGSGGRLTACGTSFRWCRQPTTTSLTR